MANENSVNTFILLRAQGHPLEAIEAKTGLQMPLLADWDNKYEPDVKLVRDSVLEKMASFIFEDFKKQISLLDVCICHIEETARNLVFNPLHAERAYTAIAKLMDSRAKVISEVTDLILEHEKRTSHMDDLTKNAQTNTGAGDVYL